MSAQFQPAATATPGPVDVADKLAEWIVDSGIGFAIPAPGNRNVKYIVYVRKGAPVKEITIHLERNGGRTIEKISVSTRTGTKKLTIPASDGKAEITVSGGEVTATASTAPLSATIKASSKRGFRLIEILHGGSLLASSRTRP